MDIPLYNTVYIWKSYKRQLCGTSNSTVNNIALVLYFSFVGFRFGPFIKKRVIKNKYSHFHYYTSINSS